jgi:hypothetical protein
MGSFCIFLCLMLASAAANAQDSAKTQNPWTGNINVFLGGKNLDHDDWEPADKQGELGVLFDLRDNDWPLSVAVDLLGAAAEETDYAPLLGTIATMKSYTSEVDIGVRKIWEISPNIRPFIGGGLSFISAEIRVITTSTKQVDDDYGTGFWLGGGVYWIIGEQFNIGVELRTSAARMHLLGTDKRAGGGHLGMLLGYHW